MKFSELQIHLAARGFLADHIGFDKRVTELRRCKKCGEFLKYRGYADAKTSLCFGVCFKCDDFVRMFACSQRLAAGKRRFSKEENKWKKPAFRDTGFLKTNRKQKMKYQEKYKQMANQNQTDEVFAGKNVSPAATVAAIDKEIELLTQEQNALGSYKVALLIKHERDAEAAVREKPLLALLRKTSTELCRTIASEKRKGQAVICSYPEAAGAALSEIEIDRLEDELDALKRYMHILLLKYERNIGGFTQDVQLLALTKQRIKLEKVIASARRRRRLESRSNRKSAENAVVQTIAVSEAVKKPSLPAERNRQYRGGISTMI